jgi:hypothetical protein
LLIAGLALTLLPGWSTAAPSRPTARTGIRLPTPVTGVDPLATINLGLRPDRLRKSVVPATVHNEEDVTVGIGPTGAPAVVTDQQRLVIRGAGNYIVRELGPARAAVGLGGTVPPVLELGTVVWQGFSPGRRELSALLTLDPGIEAARLPLKVSLEFRDAAGHLAALLPGARAPRDGTVTMTLTNNTASNRVVDAGTADIGPLATVLDRLARAAGNARPAVPPVAGSGLPTSVPGQRAGQLALDVVSPLRVTGTIRIPGGAAAVSGPATAPIPGGVSLAGTLSAQASFRIRLGAGERLGLALDVRPWLDARTVTPPAPAKTWRQWAAGHPTPTARTQATQAMVAAAAAAARSAEYSPYLQADAPGSDLSTFTYVIAKSPGTQRADDGLQPRPGAITAAALALLAVVGNAVLLRRRL